MSETTLNTPLLDTIEDPKDLRKLPIESLPTLAAEMRELIIDTVSKTGGHFASALGAVELSIALHYVFNTPDDQLVWDVGHQCYAHKILTGRRERFGTIRQYRGLSGFPRRSESPYDAFGTGHSSTSISAALGMAVADSLQGRSDRWHIAVIGDGALTGGMAIEALNQAGTYKDNIKLLIILNDNNCSISPPVGALCGHLGRLVSTSAVWKARNIGKSMLEHVPPLWEVAKRMEKQTVNFLSPTSSIFSTFDLNYFGTIDGHDVAGLVTMLRKLKSLEGPSAPIVLHISTKKGKGYAPAESNPTIYHGVNAFDPKKGIQPKSSKGKPTYTEIFSDWICDMAAADQTLFAITPAMREGSGLVEFEKRFPERYSDVAIAEQHAVTYAAGLACEGMRPVVAIYSTFAQRAYDQILHDVAIQNLPVTFAIDRGGIVGADGTTHHGVFDLAFLRCIPNMTVMTPSDESECRKMLSTAFKLGTPAAVRYPRGKGPGILPERTFETVAIGKSRTLRTGKAGKGKRVALLAFGSFVHPMMPIAEALDATLIDMRFVKPIDVEAILSAAASHDLLVTLEEGVLMGGAGSAILETLASNGVTVPTMQFGVPDRHLAQGDERRLMKECGLLPEQIQTAIEERLAATTRNTAK